MCWVVLQIRLDRSWVLEALVQFFVWSLGLFMFGLMFGWFGFGSGWGFGLVLAWVSFGSVLFLVGL